MATRAIKKFGTAAVIGTYTVASGQAATKGMPVIFASADTEVQTSATQSDTCIGVALETAVAGAQVQVLHYGPIVPVLVGTGGATRGKKAYFPAAVDGYADAPAHSSSGSTNNAILGVFMQTGVVGDYVGMMMILGNRGSA